MFADISDELSHGGGVPPLQTDKFETTEYQPQSMSRRDDFGRAALSAAALTLAFDTFSSAFAMTNGPGRSIDAPLALAPTFQRTAAETALEKVLRDRSVLLGLQMTDSATLENEARLMLLAARLRELDPRVTTDQLDVLSRVVDHLAASAQSFKDFEHEFGD